ncbi:MAP kinase-interacting serine/threonine-protein kinase mnk-1-like isoform X2 [Phoenix dactylifera]|uniref:MAP kinase-interacting serine/threonine-protein kinase mnk-1-like isoform X2 n=1 Tax=Phoenix dactylifera TaxID=42345 RepID=A0A8B9AAF6_PHODC|nr:MAP kinase-interacting serine/threonine-protein kinase mnk-1-like isoform X2 [Phoenix dactylifera]
MASPSVQDIMEFLTAHGFASAAAALRDDINSRSAAGDADSVGLDLLRPLRINPCSGDGDGGGGLPVSSASSSRSTDAFVSPGSSPSGELLNPYGIWSPAGAKSSDSSLEREFGTAREYDESNLFDVPFWDDDRYEGYLNDPYIVKMSPSPGGCQTEDKFIMSMDAEERLGKQEIFDFCAGDEHGDGVGASCLGCSEIYKCSSPLCDCCSELRERYDVNVVGNSSLTIHGRYQIFDDYAERLDECGEEDGLQLKCVDMRPEDVVLEGDLLQDVNEVQKKKILEFGLVEKESHMCNSYAGATSNLTNDDSVYERKSSGDSNNCGGVIIVNTIDDKEVQKRDYCIQPFPERASQDVDDAYEECETLDRALEGSGAVDIEGEDDITSNELQLYNCDEDEYEAFELRIIHRKKRTGFEENKDLPIVLNSAIAGRYYVTEYLGSAAFSKVVEARDLYMGIDVCLKIIKNDKDFFDQSLDEIKLLKLANKHDPADEHHILRLYDFFYHQDIARQCLEALEYLHHLRIIHCDLKPENILIKSYNRCEIKVIDLGSSCFQMDNLCLHIQSRSYRAPETILGLPFNEKIDVWSLGCILAELYTGDVLFPNVSAVMMLARMIGILGPIDMEMLVMGQETHKYFTDNFDLYHRNEETDQIEHVIPEKSSLAHHLQVSDTKFLDFLSCLLEINPRRRPTARQALLHPWLSFPYE